MKKGLFILIASILLSGCASSFKPITDVDLSPYKSLEYRSLIFQQEIDRKIVYSNGGASAGAQFGFIGALVGSIIDESVNSGLVKDAEKDMEPIRDALAGYDIKEQINVNFLSKLKSVKWATKTQFSNISLAENKSNKAGALDTQLDVITTFQFGTNFEYLEIKSFYSLRDSALASKPKKGKKSKAAKAIYQNVAIYNYAANDLTDMNKEERKAAWIADDAASIKYAITTGSSQLADMIMLDLNGGGVLTAEEREKTKRRKNRIIQMNDGTGRTIVRSANGSLIAASVLTIK